MLKWNLDTLDFVLLQMALGKFAVQNTRNILRMKNSVSKIVFVLVAIFTLQSCVTNYVVANPKLYNKEYKTDAKITLAEAKRLEEDKKVLINSFASERATRMNVIARAEKDAAIAKAIQYNKVLDDILEEAYTYIGTPYRLGGMTRRGIDCSAFVLSVFGAAVGMELPRVAAAQAKEGELVAKEDLQKGDLLFFSHRGNRIGHVGIVESVTEDGEVKFIHAATSKGVMVSSLNGSYWGSRYRMAKRVFTADTMENKENFAQN